VQSATHVGQPAFDAFLGLLECRTIRFFEYAIHANVVRAKTFQHASV
jgi:hypothetical protein